MNLQIPAIYPITDTAISGLSVREQVEMMIAGGAAFIQIREKKASTRELFDSAVEAVLAAHGRGVKVIINDRVDVALLSGADGVHLGQRDLSPVHARRLLGPGATIGYSTHNVVQARAAVEMPIDYLAFGPVFPTTTKADPDPVVGLKQLAEIKALASDLPLVAIGGIGVSNIQRVLEAGADSVAVISAVLTHPGGIKDGMEELIYTAATTNTVKHR